MTHIKRLGHTKRKLIVRRDRVRQHYWCGRKIRSRFSKNLGYRQLKRRGWKGRRFADTDGDRKVNVFDCRPLNPKRQDSDEMSTEARELYLFTDNDSTLYHQRREPIEKNLARKKYKGIYNHDLAVKAFMYLVDDGARKYNKEFGDGTYTIPRMFSTETRKEAAREFTRYFETEFDLGNYINYKQKYLK